MVSTQQDAGRFNLVHCEAITGGHSDEMDVRTAEI